VDDPQIVDFGLVTAADSSSLEATASDIVRAELGQLLALRDELLSERVPVC
jgi:hypothetical protein